MKIIELERNEFIEFSKNYPYSTFFQSPHWIDVKKDNTTLLSQCGVFVDQKMPKITKPTIAEQRISAMGDSFFFGISGSRFFCDWSASGFDYGDRPGRELHRAFGSAHRIAGYRGPRDLWGRGQGGLSWGGDLLHEIGDRSG